MEFILLAKVGMFINGMVWAGYALAGSYVVRTGIQYVRDYRESVEQERM